MLYSRTLFYSYTFCQIPWLIHVESFFHSDIISKVLQNDDTDKWCEKWICFREHDLVVAQGGVDRGIWSRDKDHFGAAGADLLHIGNHLGEDIRLCRHSDDRDIIGDKGDGAMLQFPGSICLRVDIADLL